MTEHRQQLTTYGELLADGDFEIVAITAGIGNGWNFTPDAIKNSARLWEGAHCFIDHSWFNHSLRDLAGVCSAPQWDDALQGIRLTLKANGPSGELLKQIGRELLADSTARVGFSADISFTASKDDVVEIVKVHSLDLVYDPARGGAFLRALNSVQGNRPRKDNTMPSPNNKPAAGVLEQQLQDDRAATDQLLTIQAERDKLAAEAEQARAIRQRMCANLLESELTTAKLPQASADYIRKQFAERVFEPHELTAAIDDQRKLISSLTANATVRGPARLEMFDTRDQLQAAIDDLLLVKRDPGSESLKVHRLTGIREAYHMLTGDFDMHGGFNPARAQFQATTATFPALVKNAMNKALTERWAELGRAGYDWWEQLVRVEHFNSLNQITWSIFGTVGSLPTIAEGAEYTELQLGDNAEVSSFTKYGGYVGITLETIDRDDARALRNAPRELAAAAIRNISEQVADIFTQASGAGPTLADGGALFNATAVTTAGGHANLLATALSANQWETVCAAVFNQPMLISNSAGYYGTGKKMAINPVFCLVPRALQKTARDLFLNDWDMSANVHALNLLKGSATPVTVPEWTDANDWAAVCDPALVPGICIGERFGLLPEIFIAGDDTSPAMFANDESRIKVRHYLAVGVADFRPLHKSNV